MLALVDAALPLARERPPLVDAAKNGDTDALRALLQKGADVNAAEADGTTALHWASYRDDLESADLLIRAGAERERGERSRRHAALDRQPERQRGDGPAAAGRPARIRTPRCWPARRR